MADVLLQLKDLSKYYTATNSVVAGLSNINLSFNRGEFVMITGESGSGKSTLSHVIGGILGYESGEMLVNGVPTSHYDNQDYARYRRDMIGFVSQNYGILPGVTVLGNVMNALLLCGIGRREAKRRAAEALQQVELWKLRRRRAGRLSSGQKQRLSIARALAKPAPILIADEPTGNLDKENSQKVISLLAEAAKTRLVLLVTHDPQEAVDYATRHIQLQDGKILGDSSLRPAPEPRPFTKAARSRPIGLSFHVASIQQSGRPVWLSMMVLLFALTAFAVFAFLGTLLVNLDDTPTRIYDNSAFQNGDPRRIVISRLDGEPLTQDDFSSILDTDYVQRLEPNGYVTDVSYGYRPDIDYTEKFSEQTNYDPHSLDGGTWVTSSYQLNPEAPYMQTVPQLPEGQTFLLDGRLPQGYYEVAASENAGKLGDTLRVLISDRKNWGNQQLWVIDVTIVGTTQVGEGLYFSDDMGRFFTHFAHTRGEFYNFMPNADLADNRFTCNLQFYQSLAKSVVDDSGTETVITPSFYFYDINWARENTGTGPDDGIRLLLEEDDPTTAENESVHNYPLSRVVEVSPTTFERLAWNLPSDQASILISDYAYTGRVLTQLQAMGYVALSPFRQSSTEFDPDLAQQRIQTLIICLCATIILITLQILLLQAMFSTQIKTYQLLSNQGLTYRTAQISQLWQILLYCLLGQVLAAVAIWQCQIYEVKQIVHVLRYLPPMQLLILSGIHWAATFVAAAWIGRRLRRQVFPQAEKFSDISLEEGYA